MAVKSIGRLISQLAGKDPDRPAITHEGRSVSRKELDLRTNRLARAYECRGVKPNDFVAIALPNSIEFYESCMAVWKLGATVLPISSRLPLLEREAIIELANPSLVVGAEPSSHRDLTVLPVGFQPDPDLSDAELPDRVSICARAMTSGGSTGRPKLIVLKQPGAMDPEDEGLAAMKILPDRSQLVSGPLYHASPFLYSMIGLLLGNHIVVMSRFDAEETLRLIEKYKIDLIIMVPTMMHRIWRLGKAKRDQYDLASLRFLIHLGGPCPPWLKQAWIDYLGPKRVIEYYGATEPVGGALITGDEWLTHRGSVGKPTPDTRIKIVGENGKTLGPGEIGEIYMLPLLGGQGSTYKYIGAVGNSIEGGWESVGDMGWLDKEGYLYLTDRKTDMIISGGANIYPAEVEAAIDSHGSVHSSAVIGLPDEDLGQRVHGIVYAPDGVTEEELITHLSNQLVRYKIPRSIEFVTEPLKNDAGKVRRSALIAERIQGKVL
jgi:bile acid-coenzyme A ligase